LHPVLLKGTGFSLKVTVNAAVDAGGGDVGAGVVGVEGLLPHAANNQAVVMAVTRRLAA
jgi:hypothetical protein